MLSKNLQKTSKKLISIIMIMIIIYTLINTIIVNKSYAITQKRNIDANNIYSIDESLYPGYAKLLQNLKSTHPNWTFTLLYTDLQWRDVLINETVANHERSLIQGKTGEWLCTYMKCEKAHDAGGWMGASQTAVAYYMDPRNFLTEDKIFQFETLSYIEGIHTVAGVESILKGTFMENKKLCDYYKNPAYGTKTFAQVIMEAGKSSGGSPYHIASRIRQEVGVNGSKSITGDLNGYEGYFNFYNIGASAGEDPIRNGLAYAKEKGWNTPEKSIKEGANWILNSYISKGQDSLYLQKWDVDNQYLGLYSHQYMQNIQAPTSEASSVYKTYKEMFNNNLTNTTFNFVIPMYKNISPTISRLPGNSTTVSQNAEIYDPDGYGAHIRKTPAGESLGVFNAGYQFTRIELKAAKTENEIWDKVKLSDGTIAYISTRYVIESVNVVDRIKLNETDKTIKVIPNAAFSDIQEKYSSATLISGKENLGTGAKISINGAQYTVIKLGDVNGDALVDVIDLALIKRHLTGVNTLKNEYLKAGILQSGTTVIDVVDLALIKRHLTGSQYISL